MAARRPSDFLSFFEVTLDAITIRRLFTCYYWRSVAFAIGPIQKSALDNIGDTMNSVIRNSSVVLLAMLLLTTSMTSARSYPMQDDDQAEEIRDERGFGSLVDFFHGKDWTLRMTHSLQSDGKSCCTLVRLAHRLADHETSFDEEHRFAKEFR